MKLIRLALVGLMFCCSGCSHVMSESGMKLVSTPAIDYAALSAKPESYVGKTVLVGGILANLVSSGDVTTLEVAQLGLYENGVPNELSPSGGRFLAVSVELVDPVMYRPGSLVTMVGEVKGKRVQARDGAEYPYPLLAVKEIRFFRPTREYPDPHANPYSRAVGDDSFILSPPGLPGGEPRKLP